MLFWSCFFFIWMFSTYLCNQAFARTGLLPSEQALSGAIMEVHCQALIIFPMEFHSSSTIFFFSFFCKFLPQHVLFGEADVLFSISTLFGEDWLQSKSHELRLQGPPCWALIFPKLMNFKLINVFRKAFICIAIFLFSFFSMRFGEKIELPLKGLSDAAFLLTNSYRPWFSHRIFTWKETFFRNFSQSSPCPWGGCYR